MRSDFLDSSRCAARSLTGFGGLGLGFMSWPFHGRVLGIVVGGWWEVPVIGVGAAEPALAGFLVPAFFADLLFAVWAELEQAGFFVSAGVAGFFVWFRH